jgi:hypothetical protein
MILTLSKKRLWAGQRIERRVDMMDWRPIGKILFVLSAFPWAVFIYTLFNLDALGMRLDSFWPITELIVAFLMTAIGLWLAMRK